MTADDRKQRLHRLDRIFLRTPIYFVTTCTNNRSAILATKSVHQAFIRFAEKGPGHGAWIGAYVLMPDHLHAFVGLDDQKIDLPGWMKSLKNALSKGCPLMESHRRIGKKISLTTSCEVRSHTKRSGTMSVRIQCGPDW